MRKLARIVVVAVLFVPALASAQVSLGARLGYGLAMGEVFEDVDQGDFLSGQLPLQLDLGYRVNPALTVGGYFAFGLGRVGDTYEEDCDFDGVDCTGRVYRLGIQLDYRFAGPSATPWIGAGIGYEWASFEIEEGDAYLRSSFKGFEFLNLQGGVEWKTSAQFSIGPFAMLSLARYASGEVESNVLPEGSGDIEDKSFHQWLQLGVRGRFDL